MITFDEDFGELAFAARLPAACGVVLFRLGGSSPDVDNLRVADALDDAVEWTGRFVIVEDDRVRSRALPS